MRIRTSTLLALVAVIALSAPSGTRAGQPATLGATLDTAGTWVAVRSRATVPAHVELTTEGDVHLAVTSFDLAPGDRRQIAYTGSGLGWVQARMTPAGAAVGSSGALELRAWVRYVAPPPVPAGPTWPLLLLLVPFAWAAWRIRRWMTRP